MLARQAELEGWITLKNNDAYFVEKVDAVDAAEPDLEPEPELETCGNRNRKLKLRLRRMLRLKLIRREPLSCPPKRQTLSQRTCKK